MMAIRKKCLDCTCNQFVEVKACPVLDCPLWKFRLGVNPNTEKNKSNRFLQASYFKGREEWDSQKLIKFIQDSK